MNPIVKNILAVLAGVIIGSIINMGILVLGKFIAPPPGGCDMFSMAQEEFMTCLKTAIPSFATSDYITPFLAHAVGTLVGAFTAAKIAANRNLIFALVIGAWFLYGGVSAIQQFGGAMWYKVLDLVAAYIPTAYLGWMLAGSKK